jgi:hypothetical protein
MRPLVRFVFALMVAFVALYTVPGPARAGADLNSYRANGAIAERFDGYVEIRDPNAPSDARAIVKKINAERKKLYKRRAGELNVPIKEIGKVFANEIVDTAPSGTYFRRPSGDYVRK